MAKIISIIVTYNALRHDWLHKCINSLQNSTVKNDIIIIDNQSSDDTCKVIKENFKDITLVELKENLGFGRANNIGFQKALDGNYDFVFLLNQDAWIEPQTIEKLIMQSCLDPTFGIISPLHLNGKGDILDQEFLREISEQKRSKLLEDYTLNKNTDKIYNFDFICAAAWLITRKCLEEVGGFNPSFFHYGEDNNYVHRAIFKGFKIGLYPGASIYHDRIRSDDWDFESEKYVSKRNYLIDISNPDKNLRKKALFNHLRVSLIKATFKNDKIKIQQIKSEISYFKKNIDVISENLNRSINEHRAFLN